MDIRGLFTLQNLQKKANEEKDVQTLFKLASFQTGDEVKVTAKEYKTFDKLIYLLTQNKGGKTQQNMKLV